MMVEISNPWHFEDLSAHKSTNRGFLLVIATENYPLPGK
jgi:hypothetical protein